MSNVSARPPTKRRFDRRSICCREGVGMEKEPSARIAWGVLTVMLLGYMGVYLCRVNLSVAVPMLQDAFSASKEQVGRIAAVSTAAYAAGKLLNGTIVDRIGGRL